MRGLSFLALFLAGSPAFAQDKSAEDVIESAMPSEAEYAAEREMRAARGLPPNLPYELTARRPLPEDDYSPPTHDARQAYRQCAQASVHTFWRGDRSERDIVELATVKCRPQRADVMTAYKAMKAGLGDNFSEAELRRSIDAADVDFRRTIEDFWWIKFRSSDQPQ